MCICCIYIYIYICVYIYIPIYLSIYLSIYISISGIGHIFMLVESQVHTQTIALRRVWHRLTTTTTTTTTTNDNDNDDNDNNNYNDEQHREAKRNMSCVRPMSRIDSVRTSPTNHYEVCRCCVSQCPSMLCYTMPHCITCVVLHHSMGLRSLGPGISFDY